MCEFVCISLRSQHTHTYFECGRMHSVQQNERKKRQTDTRDYSLVLLLFCLLFLFVYTFFSVVVLLLFAIADVCWYVSFSFDINIIQDRWYMRYDFCLLSLSLFSSPSVLVCLNFETDCISL